jgi:hypothetical protein
MIATVLIASIVVAAGAPVSLGSYAWCGDSQPSPSSSCARDGGGCCCTTAGGEATANSSCACEIAPPPPERERGALATGIELPSPRVTAFAAAEECAIPVLAWHAPRLSERDVGPAPPASQPLYALLSLLLI